MIKLIISDFDGTLVDTFAANLSAYQLAFSECGLTLSEVEYRNCFGLRFPEFMKAMHIDMEIGQQIHKKKTEYYPRFFDKLVPNVVVLRLLESFRNSYGLTALASTAHRPNLMSALSFINAEKVFDYILSGEDVLKGKPDPEIYLKVIDHFGVKPFEALIFEDSDVGIAAAQNANIQCVKISKNYFDYEDTSKRSFGLLGEYSA